MFADAIFKIMLGIFLMLMSPVILVYGLKLIKYLESIGILD